LILFVQVPFALIPVVLVPFALLFVPSRNLFVARALHQSQMTPHNNAVSHDGISAALARRDAACDTCAKQN
jgi:hypothetical protein